VNKREIIKHLRWLADGGMPSFPRSGVCLELRERFSIGHIELEQFFASWKHRSNDPVYPVPSGNKKYDAYKYYYYSNNKWGGKQGKLRRDLCRHIADEMEKEL